MTPRFGVGGAGTATTTAAGDGGGGATTRRSTRSVKHNDPVGTGLDGECSVPVITTRQVSWRTLDSGVGGETAKCRE